MREPLYDLFVLLLNSYRLYFYRKYSHLQVKRKLLNNTACIWFLSFDLKSTFAELVSKIKVVKVLCCALLLVQVGDGQEPTNRPSNGK